MIAVKEFSLVVDRNWRDANGDALEQEVVKQFTVIEADYQSPSVANWTITPPEADANSTLLVEFPEPMARALLNRLIQVLTLSRRSIPGRVEVEHAEMRWLFTPSQPWATGEYLLHIESVIDDLAGNSP